MVLVDDLAAKSLEVTNPGQEPDRLPIVYKVKTLNLNRQFAPWRFALDDLPASLLSVYITNDGYGCRRGRACWRLAQVS